MRPEGWPFSSTVDRTIASGSGHSSEARANRALKTPKGSGITSRLSVRWRLVQSWNAEHFLFLRPSWWRSSSVIDAAAISTESLLRRAGAQAPGEHNLGPACRVVEDLQGDAARVGWKQGVTAEGDGRPNLCTCRRDHVADGRREARRKVEKRRSARGDVHAASRQQVAVCVEKPEQRPARIRRARHIARDSVHQIEPGRLTLCDPDHAEAWRIGLRVEGTGSS